MMRLPMQRLPKAYVPRFAPASPNSVLACRDSRTLNVQKPVRNQFVTSLVVADAESATPMAFDIGAKNGPEERS
jgi:hypothetical protein